MPLTKKMGRFLFPPATPRTLIRIALIAFAAYGCFGHICIPFRIKGGSMEPTYRNGQVNFCWRLRYLFSGPARHDVVLVRFAGTKVMLLKRIVALEGETVAFSDGTLVIDGVQMDEPYVRYSSTWNLPARTVRKGFVYLVGDNRSMPKDSHNFGQTSVKRITGVPLW
jgi:signal peptidase I